MPNLNKIYKKKKGICFDYAALMAAMLRSQRIPTKLQVGYAGEAYHAWISCYVDEIGWVDNIISFDGKDWSLMDPTLAANNDDDTVKDYIGAGSTGSVLGQNQVKSGKKNGILIRNSKSCQILNVHLFAAR